MQVQDSSRNPLQHCARYELTEVRQHANGCLERRDRLLRRAISQAHDFKQGEIMRACPQGNGRRTQRSRPVSRSG